MRWARPHSIYWIICCAFVGFLGTIAAQQFRSEAQEEHEFPVSIPANVLQIGKVWAVNDFLWELPLQNTSQRAVELVHIEASCECTNASWVPQTIKPGETLTIHLTLNLLKQIEERFGVVVTGTFREAGNLLSKSWLLTAEVYHMPVTITPPAITFDEHLTVEADYKTQESGVLFGKPVTALPWEFPRSEPGAVAVAELSGTSNAYKVRFTPDAAIPPGEYESEIILYPVLTGRSVSFRNTPSVSIPVRGVIRTYVRAVPNSLLFGRIRVGKSASEALVLSSEDGRRFFVRRYYAESTMEIDVAQWDVSEDRDTLESSSEKFRVTVKPTANEMQKGNITFEVVEKETGLSYNVLVPVRCHGY